MKAFLMHKSRDFDPTRALPPNEQILSQDLELETLLAAMALKDELVLKVSRNAILTGVFDGLDTIKHRQDALRDCLANPKIIREIYALAADALERERKIWGSFREYPSGLLNSAVEKMQVFVAALRRLRGIAEQHSVTFKSDAFSDLFVTLARELDDGYFTLIEGHLGRLKFRGGVMISAELGRGLKGESFVLRKPNEPSGSWLTRILAERPPSFTVRLAPRDEAGARAMAELADRGVGLAADALSRSAEHIQSFFRMLLIELAFYIGCLNLHGRLLELGAPFTFPLATEYSPIRFSCRELYDVCLALSMNKRPVGNEIAADDKDLIIVTGANQGGKTTFLRSVGLAQLMMQCGLFAPAANLQASVVDGLFTHFKREEDPSMKSGKLDEELSRMNDIVNIITLHPMILFNESFSATNEREGSEIARQVVSALLERKFKVIFVSHQFEFAHGYFARKLDSAMFLRADRQPDGARTFKLVEAEPLATSFGEDLYHHIFTSDQEPRLTRAAPAKQDLSQV
jgi:hypothetical protein